MSIEYDNPDTAREKHSAPADCNRCGKTWMASFNADTTHVDCPSCGSSVPIDEAIDEEDR